MSKNQLRKANRKKEPKGALTLLNGKLQSVFFDSVCSICKQPMRHLPIRIPKPSNWKWTEDKQVSFDVSYCCTKQNCVQTAVAVLRKGIEDGIVIEGETPESLLASTENTTKED